MKRWGIIVSSDVQFGDQKIRNYKHYQLDRIILLKEEKNIEMVITAGDLTRHGTDGKTFCGIRKKTEDQLTPLKKEWVEPLQKAGIKTLITIGNHDKYTGFPYFYKPVFKYVKEQHNATYYPRFCSEFSGYYTYEYNGILFISCGIYPKYLRWIEKRLTKNKPMIIFYHYNTIEGEAFSDWWPKKDKDNFYNLIKDYKNNILCLINGHLHSTYDREWRGIRMINGGGSPMILLNMEDDKIKDVEIIKK